jgi:TonB-linked SusC/RagA family outer membrane protein
MMFVMRKLKMVLSIAVLLCAQFASAQVSGVIVTEDGDPIKGVNVSVRGGNVSGKTDAQGRFSLNFSGANPTLDITMPNYATRAYRYRGGTPFITLQKDAGKLDEVVVTAFGIEKSRRGQSNAAQNIKSEELEDSKRTDNWANALTGRVAGATINQTSGAPGASSQIVLRGFNSIGGDNNALVIVDGLPINNNTFNQRFLTSDGTNRNNDYTNRAADINPDDIESITVLKGPEAAALYGSEAGSGAIIIKTKRGKVQKLKVSYDNNFVFQQMTRFHEVQKVYGLGLNGAVSRTTSQFFGPKYADGTFFYNTPKNFFDIGKTQKHAVNLEGGKGFTTYRANVTYWDQYGTIPNTQNRRINTSLSMNMRPNTKWEISTRVTYFNQFNRKASRGVDGYYRQLLSWPLNDDARKWQGVNSNRRTLRRAASGGEDFTEANNPYFEVERNRAQDKLNRVTFANTVKFDPAKWLNITWTAGADAYSQYVLTSRDRESFDVFTVGGRIEDGQVRYKGFSSILTAAAKKSIGKWNFRVMAGQSVDDRSFTYWSTRGDSLTQLTENIPLNKLTVNGYTSPRFQFNSFTSGRDTLLLQRSIGVFAEFNANYKEIVYFNATGRRDYLAEFPTKNRSFFYPSLGSSLIFSELFKKNKFLTYGKYRVSVARTGKRVAPYSNQSVYTNAVGATNGYGFAYDFGANNPDLFPEQQTTFETGLEMKLFNNFLDLDVTYYKLNIKNSVAANARPSYATGFILYTSNIADLYNEGLEGVFTFKWINKKAFKWNTRFTIAKTYNRVTRLDLPEFYNSDSWLSGYRASLYRGLPTTTIGGQDYLRNNAGQIMIDPGTGYPLINQNYVRIGDRNPDFTGGITNTLMYKSIRFSFTMDVKVGGDVLNGTEQWLVQNGLSKLTLDRELVRIVPGVLNDGLQNSATPTINAIPVNPYYQFDYYTGRQLAVDFVEKDINWMRLRDVTVQYTAGPKILKKLKLFSAFSLFATGQDLLIISNYSGADPSANGNTPAVGGVGSFGIDLLNTPTPISFNFGMRVSFKQKK